MRLTGNNLSAVRGGRTLFSGLGFSVDGGAALVLTGPNGVGKTTVLRIVAGLMPPAAGRIALEGGAAETRLSSFMPRRCCWPARDDRRPGQSLYSVNPADRSLFSVPKRITRL